VINTRDGTDLVQEDDKEELYIGTASSEHIEMYLKAIWFIRERDEEVKVSSIARLLNVKQPSVVQMLHKLNEAQLVIALTDKYFLKSDPDKVPESVILESYPNK
jgi:DtxR family transcriptional regulator, Mn-dependent transcriptional regulator